jgi:hypothetical protein
VAADFGFERFGILVAKERKGFLGQFIYIYNYY